MSARRRADLVGPARRDMHYIKSAKDRQTREFAQLLNQISDTFLADKYGPQSMTWRVSPRR